MGGFIIDDNKQIYAITAAHVVSKLPEITTSKLVYRGNYDQHYLDVAFLPLKKDMPPSRLRNFLGCSDDPGVYTEYWTEYLEEFPRAANAVYPPGSKVLKVGLETGFSEGWLLDMNACPKVADQRDPNLFFTRQKMIAVRWKPCEPFTVTGDSGSIYYVIQGSLKLPIGIHSLTSSYESSHHKACIIENDGNRFTRLHEVASFACNLYKCIEWFEKENEISVKFFHKN